MSSLPQKARIVVIRPSSSKVITSIGVPRVGLLAGLGGDLEVEGGLPAGDLAASSRVACVEPLEAAVELPDRGVPGAHLGADRVLDGGVLGVQRDDLVGRAVRRPAGCTRRRPRGPARCSRPSTASISLEHVL